MHKWRVGMVLVAFTLVPGVSFADSGSKLLATAVPAPSKVPAAEALCPGRR